MKKLVLSVILMSSGLSAWAVAPSNEMKQVIGALVNNPSVSTDLKNNNLTVLTNYEISEVKQGVNKYNLSFERDCFCLPGFAQVEIIEDLTPTYSDGAPIYTSTVAISK